MKSLILISFIVSIALVVSEDKKNLDELAEKCQKENNFKVSLGAVKFDGEVSKEGKCTMACIYEKENIIKKDGTFDKDAALKSVDTYFADNKESREKAIKAVEHCFSEVKPVLDDKCETAFLLMKCKFQQFKNE